MTLSFYLPCTTSYFVLVLGLLRYRSWIHSSLSPFGSAYPRQRSCSFSFSYQPRYLLRWFLPCQEFWVSRFSFSSIFSLWGKSSWPRRFLAYDALIYPSILYGTRPILIGACWPNRSQERCWKCSNTLQDEFWCKKSLVMGSQTQLYDSTRSEPSSFYS